MTSLQKAIKDSGISYYELARLMGKNPVQTTGYFQLIASGEKSCTYEDLRKICFILTTKGRKTVDVKKLAYRIQRVIVL